MPDQDQRDPTIFGIPLMQFFVGILLFVALLYSRRDLILFCLLVLGLMSLANLWSRLSLGGVRSVSTLDKDRVFPGERFSLRITAENTRIFPLWLQIALSPDESLHPPAEGLTRQRGLLWYQKVRFQWELEAGRRGLYRLGKSDIRIGDPLGFFPKTKSTDQDLQVIVYPRLIPVKHLPVPRRDFFGVPEVENPVQDPVYILGTRDYQPGRPSRHIHWKASARYQRLQEKVFEPSAQAKVLILLETDQFVSRDAVDDFEKTIEAVASVAWQLERNGYALGLVANGTTQGKTAPILPVERNPGHISSLLEVLALLRMDRSEDLLTILLRGFNLPRGLSCLYFAHLRKAPPRPMEEFFRRRRIPLTRVVSGTSPAAGDGEPLPAIGRCWRLEDLGVRAEEGPWK